MTSSDGRAGGPGQPRRGDHLGDETLSRLVDGDLDQRALSAAEAHLATCADCRRDLDALRSTVAMLRTLPEARPRRSFQLGPQHARRPSAWRTFAGSLIPAVPALRAAALAVVLVLGGITAAEVLRDDASDSVGNRAEATVASSGAVAAPTTLPTIPPNAALQRVPETATTADAPPTVAGVAVADDETPAPTQPKDPTPQPTVAATREAAPGDAPLPAPATRTKEADAVFSGEQAQADDALQSTATASSSTGGAVASEPTDEPGESAPAASSTDDGAADEAGRSSDAASTEDPSAPADAAADAEAETSATDAETGDDASTDVGDDEADREEASDASDQAAESTEPAMASSASERSPTATLTPQSTLPARPPGSPVASPRASPDASLIASPRAEGPARTMLIDDVGSGAMSETRIRLLLAAALAVVAGAVIVVGRIGRRTGC